LVTAFQNLVTYAHVHFCLLSPSVRASIFLYTITHTVQYNECFFSRTHIVQKRGVYALQTWSFAAE